MSGLVCGQPAQIALTPLNLSDPSLALTKFRGSLSSDSGARVRVGVIDTGIAPDHPNLAVTGGRNCVFDETSADPSVADDWHDVDRHGTHVAGIIGGRKTQDVPFQGVAPGVELRAYRVFPRDGGKASSFDVMRAIDFAKADGCHLINLSLGMNSVDEALRGALGDARGAGVLVVAAAGNDARKPVLYPAAYESVCGISALGLRGSFPADSPEDADIASPTSSADKTAFLARFTNVGPQINFIAPGVGIVSTVPGGGFLSMSGTSMAAPMITGLAAALLSTDPYRLTQEPHERLKDIMKMLYEASISLGFARDHEGAGMPLPAGDWQTVLRPS